MTRWNPARSSATAAASLVAAFALVLLQTPPTVRGEDAGRGACGELVIVSESDAQAAACPLRHTEVHADIAGFLSRVTVTQTFENPLDRKIEAIYVFPLPEQAAVDDMTITVGERKVSGKVLPREEARAVYDAAVAAGHVAGLLDQERPNVFTQSVANIEPGATVVVEIRYVETVRYRDGEFQWTFPMVVGPRYIPGGGSAPAPMTSGSPTAQVPDADRITPPVVRPGTRSGADIGLTMSIAGGLSCRAGVTAPLPPVNVRSELHEVEVEPARCPGVVSVRLARNGEIANRDFVLRYRLGGEGVQDALLVHEDERGRFFSLILQPPAKVEPAEIPPRELIFVLDTSGSMSGFPIDKAKQVMDRLIASMNAGDTFNVITFAGETRVLWDTPRAATAENIAAARRLVNDAQGGGGTEMMTAIETALRQPEHSHPIERPAPGARPNGKAMRVVCFLTDGYVGNDFEIIDAVRRNARTTRVFSFGIGNSVNRFLLESMASAGRGEAEIVTLEGDADAAVTRFHERVCAPVLIDIEIDWSELAVEDVYPAMIPDLFSSQPIVVHGRLLDGADGAITLRGRTGAGPYEERIVIRPSATENDHAALPSLWARAKVEDLMQRDLAGLQHGSFPNELREKITELGVAYRLMTQFTSFVAVEELTVTVGGKPVVVDVPVEMPDGVSYEGVFGGERKAGERTRQSLSLGYMTQTATPTGGARGGRPAAPPPAELLGRDESETALGEWVSLEDPGWQNKLDPPLRKLAEGTAAVVEGRIDGVSVNDGRVEVMLQLTVNVSEALSKIEAIGFRRSAESAASSRIVIGSIEVAKLKELAELECVVRVRPIRG